MFIKFGKVRLQVAMIKYYRDETEDWTRFYFGDSSYIDIKERK